jgi:hypothetical protein
MGMSGMLFMPDIPMLFCCFAIAVNSMPLLLNTPPQKRYYFHFPRFIAESGSALCFAKTRSAAPSAAGSSAFVLGASGSC